jgi:HK97 family phage portal protein
MSFVDSFRSVATSSQGKMLTGSGFGWLGFGTGQAGTMANQHTAFTLSAFYNGVDQLSNDIAKLPKGIYKKEGKNRLEFSQHPVNYLISDYPNDMMTSFDFWKVIVISVIIRGNGYAEIITNSTTGKIESIIHRCSTKVQVYEFDNTLYYTYEGRTIPSANMLHFKAFSFDGKVGVSVITFAAKQLGISIDAQNFQQEVYSDRGLGYGVIESDKDVNPTNKKLIEEGFATKMASQNKFKVPLLDSGMQYKSITVTPAEAQFLETNKAGVLEVCRWLNIAPHKLKVLDNANFSNMQQQGIEHVQDSLLPWIIRCEQELKHKLFSDTEKQSVYVKFNEKVLLRGDLDARKNFYTSLVYAGVMTRNEARALEDMNPIEGLDEILQPVNMQALSLATELIQQQLNDKANANGK